ncbi:TonB-dependent receptor [Chondrinema litorale]|uniref:TonB-dependent receptor n=1 Tax=Chondrinema litorale TaxID=2994555 RepID=UPI002543E9B7|nr:TonB-dependent receptor [Chondrinema litorale]UZR96011.1 TonB-dependent receptor [Chondrinema litorale]
MDFAKKLTTKEKALRINLDNKIYGSFAEIGAGQDVAANFFKAGGASGTVAKTMSAYDMAFSDAIYGPEETKRYVCEPRLIKMIDKEYRLCIKRLQHKAEDTCFFAFADTVEALNYKRTNEGRGWMGLRYQLTPKSEPNECVIHIRMKDNDPILQQQAVGYVGVNLIYGCFFLYDNPEELLNSLLDEVTSNRMEIDFFRLSGPDFKDVDNRIFSLKLVKNGLTKATMFGPDGEVLQPADVLYKKNILILRGRFRPVTKVNIDMLERGYAQFSKEPDVNPENIITLSELTLSDLKDSNEGEIDEKDFMDRVNILCSLGQTVMISNYQEYYKLIAYLSKFTRNKKIGMILGVYSIEKIFMEKYYTDLKGGILESFGILFGRNIKLLVYPSYRKGSSEIIHSEDIFLPEHLVQLFMYLVANNKIENILGCDEKHLHIISDDVLTSIKNGETSWEELVPQKVAEQIKDNCLFDYPCKIE